MKEAKAFGSFRSEGDYSAFAQLDGQHPWQNRVPEGLILYPVRKLNGGKVSYFNFNLAKEMGLLHPDHPTKLTKNLGEIVLDTFCLRIINEYDQQHKTRFAEPSIKPHTYMATRYLQMQHSDKRGRTSGDGRCIWNGVVEHGGRVWDVSSRGTGVTALAPGVVQAGEPLKSGNKDHGYGCGMAEIDELFGAAIQAEIFYRNGIPTERMLAIVDLGRGVGIGIRAAPNLLRPAHLFMFLKQNKLEPLQRAVDFFIERQQRNGIWNISLGDKDRYAKVLAEIARSFANFVARLDRDYIFAWLEWDGDNVLGDAGIIDYGSVRQFGLRHDQYRYDDQDRFSTNLNEQRRKARELVQTYAQMIDYLQTGQKKLWKKFNSSPILRQFDKHFQRHCLERFLYQIGFPESHRRLLINKHLKDVESLYAVHTHFERIKTHRKLRRVADGVHRPAIFNMRVPLLMMPQFLEARGAEADKRVEPKEFLTWMRSSQTATRDRKLPDRLKGRILTWQDCYLRLLKRVTTPQNWETTVLALKHRSNTINSDDRMTGNALIHIVDEILRYRRRGLSDADIQQAIEQLIAAQTFNPDLLESEFGFGTATRQMPLVRSFMTVVHGFREDI